MFQVYKFTCSACRERDGSPSYILTTPALGEKLVRQANSQGWNLSAGNQYGGLYHSLPEHVALWFVEQGATLTEDANCGCSECSPDELK